MNNKLTYNYHTHTVRCNHAVDKDEEYIQFAIKSGLKNLGFSDHSPFIREDGIDTLYRVPVSKGAEYVQSIRALREKYKDQIDIIIGFEMEYYPTHFESMLKMVKDFGAEYLILGQHFYKPENKGGLHLLSNPQNENDLTIFVNTVIEGMNTGCFSYVAHPDAVLYKGDKDFYVAEIRRLALESKRLNIPLEVNLLGLRENRLYLNPEFWKIVSEVGSPVVIGGDTHRACHVYNEESIEKAFKMIKDYNLNFVENPKIIKI